MNPLQLAWKNTWEKPLTSGLSILLTALSTGIFLWITFGSEKIESSLKRDLEGIDLVVGAKGSPLGIILSSVYHIDHPTGNISLAEASNLAQNTWVKNAIPLALGDNYKEYRIVGTDQSYIDLYKAQIDNGRSFFHTKEVVIGSHVAHKTGLTVGSAFDGQHGVSGDMQSHEGHPFTVVGILKTTGTALDKLILTPLPTVWEVHDHQGSEPEINSQEHPHDHSQHHEGTPYTFSWDSSDTLHDITAMLITYTGPMATFQLPRYINTETSMQAAMPAIEVNRLLGLLSGFVEFIKTLAWVILLVSGLSIFIALYQQLQQRKPALALLRVQGASKWTLWWVLTWEGIFLAGLGGLTGWCVSRLGFWGMNQWFQNSYQQELEIAFVTSQDLWMVLGCIVLGIISAAPSSIQAFSLNLSKTLHDA